MEQSFLWIKSAIGSCLNEFHLDCCKSLIGFFVNKYYNDPDFTKHYDELIDDYINKETFLSVIL